MKRRKPAETGIDPKPRSSPFSAETGFPIIHHDEYLRGFAMLVQTNKGRAVIPVQRIIDERRRIVPIRRAEKYLHIPRGYPEKTHPVPLPGETVYAVMIRLTTEILTSKAMMPMI